MKALKALLCLCLVFLWVPLATVAWKGFSVEAFTRLFNRADILTALMNSILLATSSAIISTLLGTCTAFALPGLPKLARKFVNAGLVFPILLPEIAFGLAVMIWFLKLGIALGWGTLLASHVAFSFSYSTLIMKANVETVDTAFLDAARDLGAGRWGILRHALLPQIAPGLLASFITTFALSLDDFLISFFVKGIDQMILPIQIYGMLKIQITPEVYALSVLLFCISIAGVLASQLWFSKRHPQAAAL